MIRLPALALLLLGVGGPQGSAPEPAFSTLLADWIPARPQGAATGSEFSRRTTGWAGRQRQAAAVAELSGGNLPEFLRRLVPVSVGARVDGEELAATIWVMPDYLAIGSDADFLRMPLTYPAAVGVASKLGFVLPTRKIVDAVYESAAVRLAPVPMTPGPRMRSIDY